MGENAEDEDSLRIVVHSRDQPVAVAFDVEHGSPPDNVRVREIAAHVRKIAPMGVLRNPEPIQQGSVSIGVPGGEAQNRRLADHSHQESLHNVNSAVKENRAGRLSVPRT